MRYYIQIGTFAGDDPFYHNFLPKEGEFKCILVEPVSPGRAEDFYKGTSIDYLLIPKVVVLNGYDLPTAIMHLYPGDSNRDALASLMDRSDQKFTRQVEIETIKVNELLDMARGDIELLFIDAEGLDREFLLDIDFNKYKINELVFEAAVDPCLDRANRFRMSSIAEEVEEKLKKFGYKKVLDVEIGNEHWRLIK